MAKTYTFSDAVGMASSDFPKLKLSNYASTMCDEVNSTIWNYADFEWTLGQMQPFHLIPSLQDYIEPFISIPADFVSVHSAELYRIEGTEKRYLSQILPRRSLEATTREELPTLAAWVPEINAIRLHPRPPQSINSADFVVDNIRYKKQPLKVVSANLMNTLDLDDRYFHVFVAGLRYACKRDVGALDTEKAQINFLSMLANMAAREGYEAQEDDIKPFNPLVGW